MRNSKDYRVSRRLMGELLEPRCLLSAVRFVARDIVVEHTAVGARSVFAADLDGDGDVDVLSASRTDDKIAWYENTDGRGTFGEQQVIATEAGGAESVYAADVDGDGDVDVLSASGERGNIAWYENTDSKGTFGLQQVISTVRGGRSVYAADVDGDGDVDVLSASDVDDTIAWYENADGRGTFGEQQVITTKARGAESVYAADVDGDGDMDVLSASLGQIAWYGNTDGAGTFGAQQVITTEADGAKSVFAADVDGDGDVDVLSASRGQIAWYANTNGEGTFGVRRVISSEVDWAESVYAADVDGDGDVDVLSASWVDRNYGKIAWYENTDGKGTFGPQLVIKTAGLARSVYAADVDGDGDVDVLSASGLGNIDSQIAWYENTDSKGRFGPQLVINTKARSAQAVYATDVDGDGDVDVLSASEDKIAWYDNTDGNGTFGPQRVITAEAHRGSSVYGADVDGDGDVDVLAASFGGDQIGWYENTDGHGAFGPQHVISTETDAARSVYAADVDGDGDADVLAASRGDPRIPWYENLDGRGTFGDQRIVTSEAHRPESVYGTDVDGDGDVDVLSASRGKIAWYENTDGSGTFGPQVVISTEADHARSVFAEDIDTDGDVDVLSAFDDKIAWYENTDGNGTFGPQQVIATETGGVWSVYAADVDGDGDVDVLSASFGDDRIVWYENTDATGIFGSQQVITTATDGARSVHVADVDGDGDVDVLSASEYDHKIAWYENRLAGDADDNGVVAFADFLTLAANFGNRGPAWEDGDFDGNGKVEFADFLILAENFGESRQPVTAPSFSATSETLSTSNTDAFFARFDGELRLTDRV